MVVIRDGGPAFPVSIVQPGEPGYCCDGMTLRQWYIGHAPAEPQFWFVPQMQTPRPTPKRGTDPETLEDCIINWKEVQAWDDERKKQTYIQWPAAWADAMLAHEAKEG